MNAFLAYACRESQGYIVFLGKALYRIESQSSLPFRYRIQKPNLEDVFLELCLQDGDLETARVREQRSERPDILKDRKKSHKAESNGEAITFNGDLTLPEKTGMYVLP